MRTRATSCEDHGNPKIAPQVRGMPRGYRRDPAESSDLSRKYLGSSRGTTLEPRWHPLEDPWERMGRLSSQSPPSSAYCCTVLYSRSNRCQDSFDWQQAKALSFQQYVGNNIYHSASANRICSLMIAICDSMYVQSTTCCT